METISLNVKGMTCHHCTSTVEKALSALGQVSQVTIDLESGSVTVKGTATQAELIAAIEDTGFEVSR